MPRLFTALEIPQSARTHLSLVRGEIGGARWTQPDNLHLTLRFFGDIDDRLADELADQLERIEADPVEIEISGTGTFGGQSETVIYAAVAVTSPLLSLQKTHERIARLLGLAPPEHAFKPHVTLARVRNARQSMIGRFLADTGGLKLAPFTVDRFVLMSSRPGRGGGPYAIESSIPLGPER